MHPAMARQFTADHIRDLTTEAGDSRRARGGAPRPAAPAACSPEAVYPAVRAAARVPPRTLDPGRAGCGRPGGRAACCKDHQGCRGNAVVPETEPPGSPDARHPGSEEPDAGARRERVAARAAVRLPGRAGRHPGPPVLGAGRDLGAARRRRNS